MNVKFALVTDGREQLVAVESEGSTYRWSDLTDSEAASPFEALQAWRQYRNRLYTGARPLSEEWLPMQPIVPVRNVLCLGKNYRAHASEWPAMFGESEQLPEAPIVFTKPVQALCGPTDPIEVPEPATNCLDYEAELAVVIGQGGWAIEKSRAAAHVAGYTVINDTTARDLQKRHGQWFLGKALPAASPIGPYLVPADQLTDFADLTISSWVDGELRQKATLGEMIFDIETAIAEISRACPLVAGDVLAMGTPSGVGAGFEPPRFLLNGSVVVCEVERIGRLENRVIRPPDFPAADSVPGR
jgi:2-keto-4-pentenoate hydratase/2-oxohepta-3-ene-1,7-dioic acid hydratase in catechol pathway